MIKRICTYAIIFMVLLTQFTTDIYAKTLPSEVRIGLIALYENKSSLTMYNNDLLMGYDINNQWHIAMELDKDKRYTVSALDQYFLVSTKSYKNYESARETCKQLQKLDLPAYPTAVGYNNWKIYLGRYASSTEAQAQWNGSSHLKNISSFKVMKAHNNLYKLSGNNTGLIIIDGKEQLPQFAADGGNEVISLGNRSYRGKIEFYTQNTKTISAVNQIVVEDYLKGVVPGEMPPQWPMEALKAQTVAARTYALHYVVENVKFKGKPYQLTDTTSSQVYKGFGVENQTTNRAIEATEGQILTYKDSIIFAPFFSTSGGYTEDSENVWSGKVSYLRGKPDIYEVDPEKKPWMKVVEKSDVQQFLKKMGVNIGTVKDMTVTSKSEAGRAMSIVIFGSKGTYEIKKESIRQLGLYGRRFDLIRNEEDINQITVLGANNKKVAIKKNEITKIESVKGTYRLKAEQAVVRGAEQFINIPLIKAVPGQYIFMGMGYGHGVGLSQSGAKGMAEEGFKYDEILGYYYDNVKLERGIFK